MGEVKEELMTGVEAGRETAGWRDAGPDATRLHPLVELTLARIREFLREPEAVFWVFVFPMLLAFALGIAFRNTAPEQTRVAIVGSASGSASLDRVTGALAPASGQSSFWGEPLAAEEAARQLHSGKVALVVRVLDGGNPAAQTAPRIEYRYDPTRPESRSARLAVDDALQRTFGRADVVQVQEETVVESGGRYIDFLIPGLVGLNLMGSGMWGLGFAIVQARNRKLLKRLAATPMRRSHYLLSFMLSRLVFLAGEVAGVIVFAWLAFGVTVRGSLLSLAMLSLVGAAAFAGLGLLVASRARTVEGVSGLMNLVMLPMWLLSGTFFSAARFPEVLQPVIQALPLTALNESLRAVMNEGVAISATWPQIAILVGWGLVSFAIALKLFRWQ